MRAVAITTLLGCLLLATLAGGTATTTTTGPPSSFECDGTLADIVWVLDSSGSLEQTGFDDVKEFSANVTRRLGEGGSDVR